MLFKKGHFYIHKDLDSLGIVQWVNKDRQEGELNLIKISAFRNRQPHYGFRENWIELFPHQVKIKL